MKILNNVRNYLLEEEFTINIYKNKINIVNYISIDHFDEEKIVIKYDDGILTIYGKNLVVSRLFQEEVLIEGIIEKVELR